jgi:uncharacterized membrane protein HdeD (DUF308 family)
MRTFDWLRGLRVVVGLMAIAAAIIVLVLPGLAVLTLVLLLSFGLLFLGVARIAHSVAAKLWSKGHRALMAVAGVVALILGALILALPVLGVGALIFLLAFALMAYGIISLLIGAWIGAGALSKWWRALLIIIGTLSVLFSFIVVVFPALALLTLVAMLSVALLLNGIESMISGIE